MSTALNLISDLERRAKNKGVPVRQVVRAAGVNVSTWTRWKKGETTPTFGTWDRVAEKANELLGRDAA